MNSNLQNRTSGQSIGLLTVRISIIYEEIGGELPSPSFLIFLFIIFRE